MKPLLVALVFLWMVVGIGCLRAPSAMPSPIPRPTEQTVEMLGSVRRVDAAERRLTLRLANGIEEVIRIAEGSSISLEGREDGNLRDIPVGSLVEVFGTRDAATLETTARTIRAGAHPNLVVAVPEAGATVTSPLLVSGFARAFENAFAWRIKDAAGGERASGFGLAEAEEPGTYGPFRLEIFIPALAEPAFTLELFTNSAKDGSEQDLVSIPLNLLSTKAVAFDVFFRSDRKNDSDSCAVVFPVTRTMAQTAALGRTSLYVLLNGPSDEEIAAGYRTAFPSEIHIATIVISNETATVDLSPSTLEVTDACRRQTMRAQIEKTLLQFPAIQNVEIIVGGDPNRTFGS